MKNTSIEYVKGRKKEVEKKIKEELKKFTEDTECRITEINLDIFENICNVSYYIKLEVKL